jgi:predicted outer membrane repeat protein
MKMTIKFSRLAGALGLALICDLTAARGQTTNVVSNAQELQNALTTAANNGADDVIRLQAGYYVGNFNFNSSEARSLTLEPMTGLTNTDVTIDSGNTSRALNLTSSTATNQIIVRGVTFLRRTASSSSGALRISAGNSAEIIVSGCRFLTPSGGAGLGLEVPSGFNLAIMDCNFTGRNQTGDKPATIQGISGSILVDACHVSTNRDSFSMNSGASRTITNSTFIGNALNTALLIVSSSGSSTLERCAFIGNDGGASVSGSSILIRRNTFANHWGGGEYPLSVGSGAQVVDNSFANNTYTALRSSGNLTLLRNSFTANVRRAVEHVVGGNGTSFTVISNSFVGNSVSGNDGGSFQLNSGTYSATGVIQHNTFIGNSASGSTSDGGAVFITLNGGSVDIRRNVFRQNNAGLRGGAVYAVAGSVVLADNLLVNNSAPSASGAGGGAWVSGSSTLRLVNNTITQNTTGGGGGGVRIAVSNVVEVLDFYNNIIWGNTATGDGDDVYLSGTGASKRFRYNNAHDLFGVWDLADNNLDVAPQFFDPVGGDFHLQSGSPCVNAGTNGAPSISGLDLDAEPRIASGAVDMGCYEYATTATHPADADANFVLSAAEFDAYAAAWKAGQTWSNPPVVIPADYLTRAGYLLTNGGTYFNDGSARPVNWKPTP